MERGVCGNEKIDLFFADVQKVELRKYNGLLKTVNAVVLISLRKTTLTYPSLSKIGIYSFHEKCGTGLDDDMIFLHGSPLTYSITTYGVL